MNDYSMESERYNRDPELHSALVQLIGSPELPYLGISLWTS
jgi:hypothetical protein